MRNYFMLLSLLIFSLSACHNKDHEHGAEGHTHTEAAGHTHEAEDHEHGVPSGELVSDHAEEEMGEEVGLTAIQMEKIGLELGKMTLKNLKATLKVNGQLELPPQNKASVSAMAGGKVTRIHVKPGQFVEKGAALVTLQNPDFIEWQQAYLETQGQLLYLDKELVRQQDLVDKEIAAQKQLDKIQSEQAIAQARLKGLSTKLHIMGIPLPAAATADLVSSIQVFSPIAGYVRNIMVNTGTFVNNQQALFEIVDNHHLHIDLTVFEKDISYITEGQKLLFSLQSNPKEVMEARVFAIGKALDEALRAIQVHAEMISEKPDLLPGMYVEARIILEDKGVPSLPEEAVTIDKGLFYIFVKEEIHGEETHFKKIQVLTGARDFGYVAVDPLEPLNPNAEIVTTGAYFLMAQTKKGEEGAGHQH
ncbi:MAG: efflux RND transporter periplasmic adaptor subunit [Saprospiraceae bacterium]